MSKTCIDGNDTAQWASRPRVSEKQLSYQVPGDWEKRGEDSLDGSCQMVIRVGDCLSGLVVIGRK